MPRVAGRNRSRPPIFVQSSAVSTSNAPLAYAGGGGAGGGGRARAAPADLRPVVGGEHLERPRGVRGGGERGPEGVDVGPLAGQHRGLDLRELVGGRGERLEGDLRAGLLLELR